MSGILPSSTGGQWKGPAGPQRRGMAQRSTQAWNLGSGTGKDTAGMGCRELVTGVGGGKETISTWRTSPRSPWSRKLLPVFLWDGEGRSYFFFFTPYHPSERGLPRWLRVKNLAPSAGSLSSIPGLGSSPEKEMTTHSSILACKSYGLRSLGATVHGVV